MGCVVSCGQNFFESLNPFEVYQNRDDLEAYLYNQSLEIEPRDCEKPPNLNPLRKYSLKSPGIKLQKSSVSHLKKHFATPPTPLFTPLTAYG
ncbi:unnamed protein product [Soboliphyme baturini]|uniref:Ovule protein n=1 Tax=Soboliphyme baturini TaxID=241478 RepID=A0A183J2Q9_9BILA|nr:unnamed protein product [Soboliphyme baturini]